MTDQSAPMDEVRCGRSRRHEDHGPHYWRFQPEDDSPAEIVAVCPGWAVEHA